MGSQSSGWSVPARWPLLCGTGFLLCGPLWRVLYCPLYCVPVVLRSLLLMLVRICNVVQAKNDAGDSVSADQSAALIVQYHGTAWATDAVDHLHSPFRSGPSERRHAPVWTVGRIPAICLRRLRIGRCQSVVAEGDE